ncbi:MAG: hypothetical protein PHU25_10675 [Deltaproteobacteria bacterium]|nr:hypothetical protein [Deltaproteobacteria bacterium]
MKWLSLWSNQITDLSSLAQGGDELYALIEARGVYVEDGCP